MTHLEEIEFTILQDGSVEYTIHSIKGAACADVSKIFEQIGEVRRSENTAEYYEKESESTIRAKQSGS